ncbi:MAG: magnesium transporter [Defluviitaleaceae bacterium]|nr:magnesium transporter [Defluviitaleaceae bacterium]
MENELMEKVLELIEKGEINALKLVLENADEIELLKTFHDLNPKEQVTTFRLLSKNTALSFFEQLDTDEQQNLMRSFTDERAIELLNNLAPDDRVRLLDEMPAGVAKNLIVSLSKEERELTNLLMGYESETAGRIMTTKYISLRREMTVEEALVKVREQAPDKETIYILYVTDKTKTLEGVLSLKELILAESTAKIEDIMSTAVISVSTNTDQEEVANTLKELDLLALPVVDGENRIVGIITIDDAVDILENEATEDILDAAGFADITGNEADRSEVLVKGSLWKIWRVRLPFLLITLVAGLLAGVIIEDFEEALESIAIVAIFIPLIMDMGGNVGTQSSTIFARGVVLGHVNVKNFFKPFLKEVGVGLSMGMVIGIASALIITFWQGMPMLGVAVGLSLIATMTLASLLGFLVPFVLIKLKVDQAAGAAPIITSIKDIAGLLIYFNIVYLLLGHML